MYMQNSITSIYQKPNEKENTLFKVSQNSVKNKRESI